MICIQPPPCRQTYSEEAVLEEIFYEINACDVSQILKRYDFNLDMNGQKHLLSLVQSCVMHAKKAVEHQVDIANQKEGCKGTNKNEKMER